MEKVTQDFKFSFMAAEYGHFLVEIAESSILLSNVTSKYQYQETGHIYVSVEVPESLAVILKLRFGTYLVTRPNPDMEEIAAMEVKLKLNNRYGDYYQDPNARIQMINTYQWMLRENEKAPIMKILKPRVIDDYEELEYKKYITDLDHDLGISQTSTIKIEGI